MHKECFSKEYCLTAIICCKDKYYKGIRVIEAKKEKDIISVDIDSNDEQIANELLEYLKTHDTFSCNLKNPKIIVTED